MMNSGLLSLRRFSYMDWLSSSVFPNRTLSWFRKQKQWSCVSWTCSNFRRYEGGPPIEPHSPPHSPLTSQVKITNPGYWDLQQLSQICGWAANGTPSPPQSPVISFLKTTNHGLLNLQQLSRNGWAASRTLSPAHSPLNSLYNCSSHGHWIWTNFRR